MTIYLDQDYCGVNDGDCNDPVGALAYPIWSFSCDRVLPENAEHPRQTLDTPFFHITPSDKGPNDDDSVHDTSISCKMEAQHPFSGIYTYVLILTMRRGVTDKIIMIMLINDDDYNNQ